MMSQIGLGGFAGSGIGAKGADTGSSFVSGTNGGTGGWGGVGQRDYGDLEWRLKQMQDDMKFMWNRLADLEAARDTKVDPNQQAGIDEYRYSMAANSFEGGGPSDVKDYIRATKPDAGEPANRYFVDCLKENAKLIEENDVLRYQYEAMKNETARCKGLFEQLVKENQRLEEDLRGAHEKVKELESLIENYQIGAKGIRKRILELEDENKEQLNLIKLYEAANADMAKKIKELDKPYATQLNDYIDALASIGKKCKEIDDLNKRLDFFEKMSYDLEMEKKDAKWYREQAINKCIDIVELIKNDPLSNAYCKNWMDATCEDIQRAIKKEFGIK